MGEGTYCGVAVPVSCESKYVPVPVVCQVFLREGVCGGAGCSCIPCAFREPSETVVGVCIGISVRRASRQGEVSSVGVRECCNFSYMTVSFHRDGENYYE